jgi:outer membrane protein assembly factor BamB
VRFERELGERDVLLGGDGDCIGVLEMTGGLKLACLDALTGNVVWDHPIAGTVARGWHIKGQFLVAWGSPARLEALDAKGESRWSVTLPDTDVHDSAIGTGLVAHIGTDAETAWQLLHEVLVLPDADTITVVDLGNGNATVVKP